MAKTESPTLRKFSTTERTVGCVMAVVSGLAGLERYAGMRASGITSTHENPDDCFIPARTVERRTASAT
jgi:hypothetical protein